MGIKSNSVLAHSGLSGLSTSSSPSSASQTTLHLVVNLGAMESLHEMVLPTEMDVLMEKFNVIVCCAGVAYAAKASRLLAGLKFVRPGSSTRCQILRGHTVLSCIKEFSSASTEGSGEIDVRRLVILDVPERYASPAGDATYHSGIAATVSACVVAPDQFRRSSRALVDFLVAVADTFAYESSNSRRFPARLSSSSADSSCASASMHTGIKSRARSSSTACTTINSSLPAIRNPLSASPASPGSTSADLVSGGHSLPVQASAAAILGRMMEQSRSVKLFGKEQKFAFPAPSSAASGSSGGTPTVSHQSSVDSQASTHYPGTGSSRNSLDQKSVLFNTPYNSSPKKSVDSSAIPIAACPLPEISLQVNTGSSEQSLDRICAPSAALHFSPGHSRGSIMASMGRSPSSLSGSRRNTQEPTATLLLLDDGERDFLKSFGTDASASSGSFLRHSPLHMISGSSSSSSSNPSVASAMDQLSFSPWKTNVSSSPFDDLLPPKAANGGGRSRAGSSVYANTVDLNSSISPSSSALSPLAAGSPTLQLPSVDARTSPTSGGFLTPLAVPVTVPNRRSV
eukprot:ANDGO_05760.mRNA.1 hypothetical protein